MFSRNSRQRGTTYTVHFHFLIETCRYQFPFLSFPLSTLLPCKDRNGDLDWATASIFPEATGPHDSSHDTGFPQLF